MISPIHSTFKGQRRVEQDIRLVLFVHKGVNGGGGGGLGGGGGVWGPVSSD